MARLDYWLESKPTIITVQRLCLSSFLAASQFMEYQVEYEEIMVQRM